MPYASMNKASNEVNDGLDSIVIVNDLGDIPGGRTLDVSEVPADVKVIKSGHILVKNNDTKAVKPLGVTNNAYNSLPAGHSYCGVLKATVLKEDPRAAILTVGQVNAAASPYPVTDAIKAGLPRIEFLYA